MSSSSDKGTVFGVAADGSTLSHKGFEVALRLRCPNDRVTVMHVYDTVKEYLPPKYQPDQIKEAFEVKCVGNLPDGLWSVRLQEKSDHSQPARHELTRLANNEGVGVLVVGTHGRKGEKERPTILGETADFSIRHAVSHTVVTKEHCDVPKGAASYVVAVDASDSSVTAFDLVRAHLRPGDSVQCLHVSPAVSGTEADDQKEREQVARVTDRYEKLLAALPDGAGGKLTVITGKNLADSIAAFCNEAGCDFVAVGADGMRAHVENVRRLGSVSDSVIRKARCHVIVAQLNG